MRGNSQKGGTRMPQNDGNLKEQEVIYALNNKRTSELTNNMRCLVRSLFGVLDDNKIVKCYKVDDANKTDFVVEYDDRIRNVSMKSGRAVIVHNEILNNFINFLSNYGISKRTLDTICLFHYGDGTIDGSGKDNRQSYNEVVAGLQDRINEANDELNSDMDFIIEVLDHCMFKGSNINNIRADCVYFGDKDYGIVATRNQFIKNTKRRGFDFYSHLHIGPLLFRPDARYVDKEITHERKRNRIVAYWPNLREDIEYMSKRYNY